MTALMRHYAAGVACGRDGMMAKLGIPTVRGCCGHKPWSVWAWR
jgi:hypothetical protein